MTTGISIPSNNCFSIAKNIDITVFYEEVGTYTSSTIVANFVNGSSSFYSSCIFRGLALRCLRTTGETTPEIGKKYSLNSITDTSGNFSFILTNETKTKSFCFNDNCVVKGSSPVFIHLERDPEEQNFEINFEREISDNIPRVYLNQKEITSVCSKKENSTNILKCSPTKENIPKGSSKIHYLDVQVNECGEIVSSGIQLDPDFGFNFFINEIIVSSRCVMELNHFMASIRLKPTSTEVLKMTQTGTRTVTFRKIEKSKATKETFEINCHQEDNVLTCYNLNNSVKNISELLKNQYYLDEISSPSNETIFYDNRKNHTICFQESNCLDANQEQSQTIIFGDENFTSFSLRFQSLEEPYPSVVVNGKEIRCSPRNNSLICLPTREELLRNETLLKEADVYVSQCEEREKSPVVIKISTFVRSLKGEQCDPFMSFLVMILFVISIR